ncbi:DNA-binding protein [Pseudonocardia acidicola]|uniref:DNA-binding protein n=1 Tax=Pseudonocardia acidicola TaxID=2724939 RepID=A0ABX1SF25_9PSEU|nr:DNA-binding protein [Pseudonocardia acidicola]NMH99524.1 DNA-binding protein [Pseudonocardia acidicola]
MGTDAPRVVTRKLTERERRTAAAWEKFVAGEDDVHGVPLLIVLSWHRSRDLYLVDPLRTRPPPCGGSGTDSLLQNSVRIQLGGIAASIADHTDGALTTVTDDGGRVLGCWGTRAVLRRGADSHLAPLFTWSEPATGTNGMGTALSGTGPVSVRGPEHWCAGLHDWSCTGVAIRDPVTRQPIAVLNVSFWRGDLPRCLPTGLAREVAPLEADLHRRSVRNGIEIAEAFGVAQSKASPGEILVAVDAAGNVVVVNERAHALRETLPVLPATEPRRRWTPDSPELRDLTRASLCHAEREPRWAGVAQLDFPSDETTTFELRPIRSADDVIGLILTASGGPDGERIHTAPPQLPSRVPQRVVGIQEDRIIILTAHEIRYAEADKHTVWLVTDQGRVRAACRGLDDAERELVRFGFLRVHRSYLVNLHRIREVDQGPYKGTLTVSTQHHGRETIPVARRHTAQLRDALGIQPGRATG